MNKDTSTWLSIMHDRLNMYKKAIEVNVTALVTVTLKAIEYMRKDKGGRGGAVINISSIAGLYQTPLLPIYFATKSAVLQFSNCIGLQEYYSRTGVRVMAACFGATSTPLVTPQKLGSFDPEFEENVYKLLENEVFQTAEEAAKGLIDVHKHGKSGSTWLIAASQPAQDISNDIHKAYEIMCSKMLKASS